MFLPRFTIPKLEPKFVFQTLSETYDWGLQDLHIPNIHKQTLGEDIKIAIIDSGKSDHFELSSNIADSKNFTPSPTVSDKAGHSTFVSGVVAAEQNNDGIIGVAPKSKIYFAKAIDDGGVGDPSSLVNAVNWATSIGVDIISISAGMFIDFKPLHEAIKVAYSKNIIIVCAVGNSGARYYDVAYPARYPECIGVGAYDRNRQVAPFSSRGQNVSFSMPGVEIYSTWLDNQYCSMNGTSFAAPIMTGICALILAKHRKHSGSTPCNTPKEMLEHLQKYAVNLGNKSEYGFGTVDLSQMDVLD